METRAQKASLNIKLSVDDTQTINDILSPIRDLLSLSANELLKMIGAEGFNSITMTAIFKMLTLEEGPATQTYKDPGNKNYMTITVGLKVRSLCGI